MHITLTDLIDAETLQGIQDSFSNFIGMAASTTDEKGVPVTDGSAFSNLCRNYIRSTDEGRRRCEECARNGANKTREAGKAMAYDCHAGLVDFAAPILVDGQIIGSFIGGQVRISDVDEEKERKIAEELGIDPDKFVEEFKKVNKVSRRVVVRAAQFLSQIANVLSQAAYHNMVAMEESRKKEEYALFQSDYFMRINDYMKQQFMTILAETMPAEKHENAEILEDTLNNVINKINNVLTVVDHMVEYLSLTGGDLKLKEEKYDIRELLKPIKDMSYGMQGLDLSFHIEIDKNVPERLFGDPMRISYIISRILDNRFSNTPMGWIMLRVHTEKRSYATMLMIEISDTGERFSSEKLENLIRYAETGKVFEYNAVDDSNTSMEVIGLLINQLSGKISFDTGRTNTVRIEIPQLEIKEEA